MSLENLRQILDGDNSELLRRPAMGLGLGCASADAAGLFLPHLEAKPKEFKRLISDAPLAEAIKCINLSRECPGIQYLRGQRRNF